MPGSGDGIHHLHSRLALRRRGFPPRLALAGCVRFFVFLHRVIMNNIAAPFTGLTNSRESLHEALPHALAGHLHQAQGGYFRYLVAGAITPETLDEPAQHQVTVGFQNHINKVNNHNPADIAQPQLPHDFFGRFQIIAGNRFF